MFYLFIFWNLEKKQYSFKRSIRFRFALFLRQNRRMFFGSLSLLTFFFDSVWIYMQCLDSIFITVLDLVRLLRKNNIAWILNYIGKRDVLFLSLIWTIEHLSQIHYILKVSVKNLFRSVFYKAIHFVYSCDIINFIVCISINSQKLDKGVCGI